jgi:hypothetical protein
VVSAYLSAGRDTTLFNQSKSENLNPPTFLNEYYPNVKRRMATNDLDDLVGKTFLNHTRLGWDGYLLSKA